MWLSRNKEHKDTQDQGAAELQAIRQSMAMIDYLDETRPEPPLLPADPGARAIAAALRRARSIQSTMAVTVGPHACCAAAASTSKLPAAGGWSTSSTSISNR